MAIVRAHEPYCLSQFKTEHEHPHGHFNQLKVKLPWQLEAASSWAWPLCRTLHLAP